MAVNVAAGQTKVTIGSTTTKVVDANNGRKYLYLCNNSNEDISLKFGVAAVAGEGFIIKANGGYHSFYGRDFVPEMKGQLNAICASGSKDLAVVEFGDGYTA